MARKKIRTAMRRFHLHRDEDESGVSGTGLVAEGIEFTNGRISVMWLGTHHSTENFDSMKSIEAIHGHRGKTRVVYVDPNINVPAEQ